MEKENFSYELLEEETRPAVERLFEVYRKNPYNARVIYMNATKDQYEAKKVVAFKDANSFNIVMFRKRYGISKTNRIYNSEARISNISYKNGKFYLISNKIVRPLTYRNLRDAFGNFTHTVCEYLIKDFSWLRFIREKDVLTNVAFNTIISKKLYSYKKAISHQYNVPYPIGEVLHNITINSYDHQVQMFVHHFKKNLEYLENITSLDGELLKNNKTLFVDTVTMARVLNKKVNCKWKLKRLKEMHDLWTEEITDITFMEADRVMTIHPIFYKFSEFANFTMLKTTKEMCIEGRKNSHCVATYVNRVESNTCAIYHVDGYTLEIRHNWGDKGISYGQFRGYKNAAAPAGLDEMVKKYIGEFNVRYMGMSREEYDKEMNNIEKIGDYVADLPF